MGSSRSIHRRNDGFSLGNLSKLVCFGMALLSTVQYTEAYSMEVGTDVVLSPLFQELAQVGEIHIDRRTPPTVEHLNVLGKRNTNDDSTSTVTPTSTSASASASVRSTTRSSSGSITASAYNTANSTSPTVSSTSSSSSTSDVPTALPTPFDTSLGNNFTQLSCPTFFNTFINNATFKSCLPVSLLLQNSIGFFKGTKSATYLNNVLDAACAASLAICSPLMAKIAGDLIDDANCGQDYKRQNPIVMQAYTGLVAYEPLSNATCLPNRGTGNYCFVDAVVNTTNAADTYPYYMALGIQLPSSAQPSCSTCLQQTLNIFAGYAKQSIQPLSKTYNAGATQIDGKCGATFANTNVKVVDDTSKKSAATRSIRVSGPFVATAILTAMLTMV